MNKTHSESRCSNVSLNLNLKDKSDSNTIKRKKITTLKIKKRKFNENIFQRGKWDKEEHKRFLEICLLHGNKWPKVNNKNSYSHKYNK